MPGRVDRHSVSSRQPGQQQRMPDSGGASAMKEPGHFVVRKFSSQVTEVRSPGVPNALSIIEMTKQRPEQETVDDAIVE